MKRAAIVSAVRTPIGKFLGSFQSTTAVELGAAVTREALKRARIEAGEVDEFIYGNARQAGSGPNPARQISIGAGMPPETPAYTINKACASGMKAMVLGLHAINMGDANIIAAGGTENMTRVPYMLEDARLGYRMGHGQVVDGMYRDGFLCPISKMLMGATAEKLADMYSITRREQDEFALGSQQKAERAEKEGRFADEIVPVIVKTKKKEDVAISKDEHPRHGATIDELSKLPPVFRKDGTVTAGNSSGITDGAATVVVVSEDVLEKRGLEPLGFIQAYSVAGVDASVMGIAVVPAVKKLFQKTGLDFKDIDLVEANEAFAAQVLAVDRELNIPKEKLNVNGGAIALGHPIGATGARIVVTLLHEMKRRGAKTGLATLCVSGGQGMAMLLSRR